MANETPVRLSRGRKSRGRGLRTNTGCATCRKRHLKCDEVRPVCGPCLKVSRQCAYSQSSGTRDSIAQPPEQPVEQPVEQSTGRPTDQSPEKPVEQFANQSFDDETIDELSPGTSIADPATPVPPTAETNIDLSPAKTPSQEQNPPILAWTTTHDQSLLDPLDQLAAIVAFDHTASPFASGLPPPQFTSDIPHSVTSSIESPGPTVNAATVRWFDLLANDAVRECPQTTGIFAGYGQDILEESNAAHATPLQRATRIVDRTPVGDNSDVRASHNTTKSATHTPIQSEHDGQVLKSPVSSSEQRLWQAEESIQLLPQEYFLFENFIQRISPWIDLFDPTNKFSTFVPHLAMRNAGLLNAILALSSRHLSVNPNKPSDDQPHRENALQYYYQTLHYVQKAMQYSSYKTSLELLATTLIISTYEMLDDSSQDWQRHLEGVFLIQRSQVIHGDSGGLKSAVWWAWLCQDVWAAFRERRKTLTFWVPKKTYADLSPAEIAARSIFVLSKVVNYCSQEESMLADTKIQARIDRAKHLRRMLDEWWSHLTVEFSPLPTIAHSSATAFRPIWIRTPAFAVAVQLHCVSHILIYSHEPCAGGMDRHLERQTRVRQCVEIICGIAMTLKDDASSLVSSQCLFIAGMFTQDNLARECVLNLLESCRRRTGWPVHSFEDELKQLWIAHELPKSGENVTYANMLLSRH